MFEFHDPKEEKKHFLDRTPQFWDNFARCLFVCGISIVLFILVFKWLGYFGS